MAIVRRPKPLKKNVQNKFFKGFTISQKKTFVKGFIKPISTLRAFNAFSTLRVNSHESGRVAKERNNSFQ